MLLKRKANVDAKCQGVTPLFIAAQENHLPVVQALLSADCDVNLTNPSLAAPLFIAVQKGNTNVVKTLVKRKKKVSALRARGRTCRRHQRPPPPPTTTTLPSPPPP
jgi:ankyrin repeat protein